MRKPNIKCKHNNTIWSNFWGKKRKKNYITITVVILVEPYVASIFLASNMIGDEYDAQDHEFVQLYEDMPHDMNDGLVAQWVSGILPSTFSYSNARSYEFRSSSTIMLCSIIHAFMIIPNSALSMLRAGPRTMVNRDCRTPNALSTSFLTAS